MKRIEKKLANNVDYSNHVWMQYAEVRIVSGFGKGMLKCVVGTIMPKSNHLPVHFHLMWKYRYIVLSKILSPHKDTLMQLRR
jgi:hypothetical protein